MRCGGDPATYPILTADLVESRLRGATLQLVQQQTCEEIDAPRQDDQRVPRGAAFLVIAPRDRGGIRDAPMGSDRLAGLSGQTSFAALSQTVTQRRVVAHPSCELVPTLTTKVSGRIWWDSSASSARGYTRPRGWTRAVALKFAATDQGLIDRGLGHDRPGRVVCAEKQNGERITAGPSPRPIISSSPMARSRARRSAVWRAGQRQLSAGATCVRMLSITCAL